MTAPLSLRDLIASINAKKAAEKKPTPPPAAKKPPVPLTLVQSQNLARTGYISWKPISYTIQTTRQICACCGAETEAVTGEFFTYENGTAHAVWSHREGYGIEDPDDLPISYIEAEPKYVRACASCRWAHVDLVRAIEPAEAADPCPLRRLMNFYLFPVAITPFATMYHLYHQGSLQSRLSCDCPELLPALAEFLSSPEGQQFNPFHF